MSGLGTSTQKSTNSAWNMNPQWTQDAQENTYSQGVGMLEQFLRNPQYAVAGFNPDQLKAYDQARQSMQDVYTAPRLSAPGSPNFSAALANPSRMEASSVTPGAITEAMNPFLSGVVNATRDTINRDYQDKDAQLAGKYAAANAFGGSGEAIARGQLARGANETLANVTATLMAQGYDKATATALANAQMGQQAASNNAQMGQQTSLANQAAINSMRGLGADYGLKATQVDDALRTSQLGREMTTLQQILTGGGQQQQLQQQALNVPWTMLQLLMGLTPDEMNSFKFSQGKETKQDSPMSTITSGISALTGLKGLFGGK